MIKVTCLVMLTKKNFSRNNLIDYSSLSDEIYITNIVFT